MTEQPARPDAVIHDLADASGPRHLMVDGVRWSVRLFTSRYDRRSRPDLLFESEYVMRRVRNYPSDWRELSDEQLFALSLGR